jgi:NADH-quinone oxidoreductase subunit G
MAVKRNKGKVIYMHPIEDLEIKNLVTQYVKYEAGSEEGVIAMLLELLLKDAEVPSEVESFLEDLDIGYLSGESSVSEEELDKMKLAFWKRKKFTLVVGSDIFNHSRVENIAKMVALIEKYSNFELLVIPPHGNSLGVSLICDLSENVEGCSVGYNVNADFTLSALGDGDLDMPSLNQQEGTITTVDKKVVPLNVALPYDGYILNDIANALGVGSRYTIDFTKELPTNKGFKAVEFDSLENDRFSASGDDLRGYDLETLECEGELGLEEVDELPSFDGVVVYCVNPAHNPNSFTNKAKLTTMKPYLKGSKQFALAAKVADGDIVEFELNGKKVTRVFSIDTSLKGTIALNPTFDLGLSEFEVSSYRFLKVNISKVGARDE